MNECHLSPVFSKIRNIVATVAFDKSVRNTVLKNLLKEASPKFDWNRFKHLRVKNGALELLDNKSNCSFPVPADCISELYLACISIVAATYDDLALHEIPKARRRVQELFDFVKTVEPETLNKLPGERVLKTVFEWLVKKRVFGMTFLMSTQTCDSPAMIVLNYGMLTEVNNTGGSVKLETSYIPKNATVKEVCAFLLVHGELPTREQAISFHESKKEKDLSRQ